jgi:hypothetical protein
MATKLHELVAVEPTLQNKAGSETARAIHKIEGGQTVGETVTYTPLEEGGQEIPPQHTPVSVTVQDVLSELGKHFGAWLDVSLQKEVSNIDTSADIVVGGKTLFVDLPAPALLNLEKKLAALRNVLERIQTNDPAYKWTWNKDEQVWVSDERVSYRTKKVMKAFVAYEATDEHPAQVETFTEDERISKKVAILRSGNLSVREKRVLMSRIDELIAETKRARQRANDTAANTGKYAEKIFDYLLDGLFEE